MPSKKYSYAPKAVSQNMRDFIDDLSVYIARGDCSKKKDYADKFGIRLSTFHIRVARARALGLLKPGRRVNYFEISLTEKGWDLIDEPVSLTSGSRYKG